MRKFVFLSVIVLFILLGCNPLKPKSGASAPIFNAQDSIPSSTALAMIAHYNDPNFNKQGMNFEAGWTLAIDQLESMLANWED